MMWWWKMSAWFRTTQVNDILASGTPDKLLESLRKKVNTQVRFSAALFTDGGNRFPDRHETGKTKDTTFQDKMTGALS